ncbi:MAG: hypothetical protein V8R18_06520 [Clostridium sp.]
MNVISLSGGIDIMVAALEHVMSKRTAAMIMGITSGFMSFFSSGLGVVFPTLIPTASGLASTLGADAMDGLGLKRGSVLGLHPIGSPPRSVQPDLPARFCRSAGVHRGTA